MFYHQYGMPLLYQCIKRSEQFLLAVVGVLRMQHAVVECCVQALKQSKNTNDRDYCLRNIKYNLADAQIISHQYKITG